MRSFAKHLELRVAGGFHSAMTRRVFRWSMRTILCLAPFSIAVLGWDLLADDLSWMAPVSICMTGAATVLSESRVRGTRYAARSLILFASLVLVVEIVGVYTGLPFGSYRYTDVLGPSVGGVPLVIPLAWYATIVNAVRIAEHIVGGSRIAVAFGAAVIALGVYILLEPTAAYVHHYWQWDGHAVPMENYVTWCLLSVMLGLSIQRSHHLPGEARIGLATTGGVLMLQQVILFAITDILYGYLGAVVTGLLVIGALTVISGGYRIFRKALPE
jgi:uncharacterized membrane protein